MTTSQMIDGVPRELLERCARELSIGIGPAPKNRAQELRALLDKTDAGISASTPQGEPVAFLDIGAGGYVDLGTDQPLEALEKLPYGRHMLGIIGTYGADGWQPIVKHPTTEIEPVAYAVLADNGNIRVWSRSPEVVEIICGQGLTPVPLYAEQPAPVAVVLPEIDESAIDDLAGSSCQEALAFGVHQDVFARLARTVHKRTLDEVTRLNPSL
ncbi:hypothetical protein [Pseudomonas veronii]|uniref:hypothetical protein n=1 Tax=Pseudomonas veronii TaxID=76761 RepID=UPI00061DC131|nr:hypothetical protein [Pseudomonas veronii]